MWVRLAAICVALLLSVGAINAQESQERPASDSGLFTVEQVETGENYYRQHCAECHGIRLGGGMGPALNDEAFLRNWGSATVAELDHYIRTEMPLGRGGALDEAEYTDMLAFILSSIGHPAGPNELSVDSPALLTTLVDTSN